MPIAFSTSLRALKVEQGPGRLAAALGGSALLIAWGAWLFGAELAEIEVSTFARIETSGAAVPVATLVSGRVTHSRLELGDRVQAGEDLVLLDSGLVAAERAAEAAAAEGLRGQITATKGEQAAIEAAIEATRRSGRAQASVAQASAREAAVAARLAHQVADRSASLAARGATSTEMEEVDRTSQRGREARATAGRIRVSRSVAEAEERAAALEIELARLERRLAELRGELARREGAIAALDRQLAEYTIKAPIAGTLAAAPPLPRGTVLTQGSPVARIVADDELRIVASFEPAAIGRIRPTQPIWMHLDGYPRAEYGSLRGRVSAISSEPIDGLIRVECQLAPSTGERLPQEHGLTGIVEVEVERLAPATLAVRLLGDALRLGVAS